MWPVYTTVVLLGVHFAWDPEKSAANLAARGFDFEFAALIFERVTLERTADRRDYGERRVVAIGVAQGLHLTVAYTDRRTSGGRSSAASFRREGAIVVNARRIGKRSRAAETPPQGRVDLTRLGKMTEREIDRTSPPELANLPADFWNEAEVIVPPAKQAISLRVDQHVLAWFKRHGPRYQTMMNAVLRAYVSRTKTAGKDKRTSGRRRSA